jgi:hypothetical protein
MSDGILSLSNKIKTLTVPDGRTGRVLLIDVSNIYETIDRIREIPRATMMTAPELMSAFNMAMVETTRLIGIIDQQKVLAESSYREEKSVSLLTRTEDSLLKNNHKSTADLREAVVTSDPLVKDKRERSAQLEVLSEMFHNTYHDLRDALYSVKKICDVYVKLPSDPGVGS